VLWHGGGGEQWGLFASGRRADVGGRGTPVGDESGFGRGGRVELGCRRHSRAGKREPRGVLRYADAEWAVIVQVAALASMRPGAWVQQAAYETAVRAHRGLEYDRGAIDELLGELRQHRRVLTNIGGNLNDVARAANATGMIEQPVAAATVLRLVRNVVLGSDELIRRVRSELLP